MDDDTSRSWALLAGEVPLSLLLDLALGPDSEAKLRDEPSAPADPG